MTHKIDKEINLLWDVKISMRDGVKLAATIYKPKQIRKPRPVIFRLTPYTADRYHEDASSFSRNGYVFALVDCRGRGNSGGRFEPHVNEGHDGYDTVEWLAHQSWSNGKIGLYGGSYEGFVQWATAKELPPQLVTIAPVASACPGVEWPFFNNIWFPFVMQWLTQTSGVTTNSNLSEDSQFWIDKFFELHTKHLPFKDLDRVVGNLSTNFQKLIEHPTLDGYWEQMIPTPEQYRQINLPILTITGQYDANQRGALHYYHMHMKYGTTEARAQHYLIIGPWDHAGTGEPCKEVGGLKFGDASLIDIKELQMQWYDWTLKGEKKPDFLDGRVAYYILGGEVWKYADSLDSIANTSISLYLSSANGSSNDVFRSGRLSEQMLESPPDQYTYDPLDIRPAEFERLEIKDYLTDQRSVLNLFGNGLVYHSEPFIEELELSGYVRAIMWIEIDVPDTDLQVWLYEVHQDGTAIDLTYDRIRARYRQSLTAQELIRPGEINVYEFKTFLFISRRIAKGSRLRLVLTSPNTIHLEKNYNGGGVVTEESGKDAKTANIILYHDAERQSFIEIPIHKRFG